MYRQPNSQRPNVSAKTKAFLDALAKQNAKPLYELSYPEARQVLLSAQTQIKMPKNLDCDIMDMTFPVGPLDATDVRLYRPKDNKDTLPVLVYYHGGGWVMGNKITHERLMRTLCVQAGIAILFVDYTPSPESGYPDTLEQGYAALEYLAHNASEYKVDASRIAVGGDSVGGNMAGVMCLWAKKRQGVNIVRQFLLYPVADGSMSSPSYHDFAEGPWLTQKAMAYFWQAYAPKEAARYEAFASLVNAESDALVGLPAAFVLTIENDVLRDEGEAYANKLMQAGCEVVAVRYKGTIHDFMMLDGLMQTAPAKAAVRQLVCELKYTFGL